jgi:hypothetical protein
VKLWKVLDLISTALVVPFYGALGVLVWISLLGGPPKFALPATLLLFGSIGLFLMLQVIVNNMQDSERRKRGTWR